MLWYKSDQPYFLFGEGLTQFWGYYLLYLVCAPSAVIIPLLLWLIFVSYWSLVALETGFIRRHTYIGTLAFQLIAIRCGVLIYHNYNILGEPPLKNIQILGKLQKYLWNSMDWWEFFHPQPRSRLRCNPFQELPIDTHNLII